MTLAFVDRLIEAAIGQHSGLAPEVWEGQQLRAEVHARLMRVVDDFLADLPHTKARVVDVIVTGSICTNAWTEASDIDTHIVMALPEVEKALTLDALHDHTMLWNQAHNIHIGSHPVELYVQDEKEPHYSNGVYSLLHATWVQPYEPVTPRVDTSAVEGGADHYRTSIAHVSTLFRNGDYATAFEHASALKARLKQLRSVDLKVNGAFGHGNLVFKSLRHSGHLEQLMNLARASYDHMVSL